jgi:hypothetical protein
MIDGWMLLIGIGLFVTTVATVIIIIHWIKE